MKCVCPMGGDRTCPDDCPLAVWANLSPTARKAQRKPVAERLYKQGFTMEVIATQLGVGQATITRDLRNLSTVNKSKDEKKTASNPKGAGRPKGSGNAKGKRKSVLSGEEGRVAALVLDEGKSLDEAMAETGVAQWTAHAAVAHEEGRRLGQKETVAASDLSMTAQQRLEVMERRIQREQDLKFEQRVRDEVKRRIDEIVLPHWKEQIEQSKELYRRRRALMTKDKFNKIRRALHPDSRLSISDKILAEAFDTFMALEKYLLDEEDSPTPFHGVPKTLAEWHSMRQKAQAD